MSRAFHQAVRAKFNELHTAGRTFSDAELAKAVKAADPLLYEEAGRVAFGAVFLGLIDKAEELMKAADAVDKLITDEEVADAVLADAESPFLFVDRDWLVRQSRELGVLGIVDGMLHGD